MIAYKIFKEIIDAGPTILLPIIILLLGLAFRLKIAEAVKSAIVVGVGYAGLKLVVGFLTTNLGPVTAQMVKRFGLHLNVLDVGFGTTAAIGWSSPIVPLMVFAIMGVNIFLLIINKTNTLSVDLWNYHHCLTVGAVVYFATKSVIIGTISAGCTALVVFKLADWASPLMESYYKMPGITTPAMQSLTGLVFYPVFLVLDKIPGINKINFNMNTIRKYLGTFGDPVVLGLVLGCGIGALANYPAIKMFGVGVNMATAMALIPKMTHMFVDGLKPISEQAKLICETKLKGRKILIGLDPSILLGDSAVITTSLVMVPITLGLAAILPANRILPFADLGAIGYKVALLVAICNGNMFRALVMSSIFMVATLLCGTNTAALVTATAKALGIQTGAQAGQMITSLTGPSMPVSFLIVKIFTGDIRIMIPIFIIAFTFIWVLIERMQKKKNFTEEEIQELA